MGLVPDENAPEGSGRIRVLELTQGERRLEPHPR